MGPAALIYDLQRCRGNAIRCNITHCNSNILSEAGGLEP